MRVLNIPCGPDTGGQGIRIKQAFDRYVPDWTYNVVANSRKYMLYDEDQPWTEAKRLWDAADVVHLRNNFRVEQHINGAPKPAVIHHHGTEFRTRHAAILRDMRHRNVLGLAATLDLYLLAPDDTVWLPAPYDIDRLQSLRPEREEGDVLRIAHAPTDRRIKSTDAFLRAVDKLRKEILVELILIENQRWDVCLQMKARADIFFDQVILGYGNNSIEAWGMGVPVIAGAADDTLAEMTRRFDTLPFYLADEGSVYHALRDLADQKVRAEYSRRGLDHVRRWHDDKQVVKQLVAVYEDAVDRF